MAAVNAKAMLAAIMQMANAQQDKGGREDEMDPGDDSDDAAPGPSKRPANKFKVANNYHISFCLTNEYFTEAGMITKEMKLTHLRFIAKKLSLILGKSQWGENTYTTGISETERYGMQFDLKRQAVKGGMRTMAKKTVVAHICQVLKDQVGLVYFTMPEYTDLAGNMAYNDMHESVETFDYREMAAKLCDTSARNNPKNKKK